VTDPTFKSILRNIRDIRGKKSLDKGLCSG
jgi:hypothetical protein